MNIDSQLLISDLTEQIALIHKGDISAIELYQQQLALINNVNPQVNAFISIASNTLPINEVGIDSTLAGVGIAVKDNIDVRGFSTTAGLETLRHNMPEDDAFVIENLRRAGACFSGKLNMHEGALGASNHNSHYGDCFNPHNLTLTPGGSSGGSAAAVASGMAALALGSDTMGSVRIPASYCGVFGFKASRGAISNRGSVPCARIMDNIGPIARSARDLSLAFDIMQGFDPLSAESVLYDFDHQNKPVPTIIVPEELASYSVDESIIADFTRNLSAFEQMGCTIKRVDFSGYNFSAARRAGLIICEAEMRVVHGDAWQNTPELFSPYLRGLLSYIDKKTPMDLIRAERTLDQAVVFARQLFNQGEFLLMPTAPQRAFAMASDVPANQADLTSLANQAGLPAATMPMLCDHALPAGMQLIGKRGSDYQLLALVEQWQRTTEYFCPLPEAIKQLIE